jgi:hypothetical protein
MFRLPRTFFSQIFECLVPFFPFGSQLRWSLPERAFLALQPKPAFNPIHLITVLFFSKQCKIHCIASFVYSLLYASLTGMQAL